MKIVELIATGFARIKAVTVRPDGALVEITGKNGHGKSSTLLAIWTAIEGKAVAPPVAINKDSDEAVLRLNLGELKITRTFTRDPDGPGELMSLKVVMADGRRVTTRPQAVLDALVGALTFDPLQFAKEPPKKQFDALKHMVPGYDFEAAAVERKRLFDDRTAVNRQAGDARVMADQIELPAGKLPKTEPSTAAIAAELTAALQANSEIEARTTRRRVVAQAISTKRDEAERLRAQAATLESQADADQTKLDEAPALPAKTDTAAIQAKLATVEEARAAWQLGRDRTRHEADAARYEKQAEELTGAIATLDAKKTEVIAKAKLPGGLTLGDGEVMLKGVPFVQAGTAEKIDASMEVAMALNPTLKVILCDEGSELDSIMRAQIAAKAEARGFQVWVTRVEESGEVGFYIEDGTIQ